MKSLILLWEILANDLGQWCHASTSRDIKTVTARVEDEGLSFLTITLPSFGKGLEKGLADGKVSHDLFPGFRFTGGIPSFLKGFLGNVFDRETGLLLDDPCVDSIFAVRQLTLVFGKIQLPCSEKRVAGAMQQFVKIEQELRELSLTEEMLSSFSRIHGLLFGRVFTALDREIYDGTLIPKHGPGSTADRLKGNQKYIQTEWTERLEKIFPYVDYAIPNHRYWRLAQSVNYLSPGAERPVRVISVPKTLKTPRIIAIEPTCMQYMQQAILEPMIQRLESDLVGSWLVGFERQEPNQLLARLGSQTGSLATLDLSEASDRVSNQLMYAMTRRYPWVRLGLDATRSRKADVPGKGVIRLAKYASMGSALCFPVEAMVFATVIFYAIEQEQNRPLTMRDVMSYRGRVRVYGDDIIVPTDLAECVSRTLNLFGFKVNTNKSFWTGKFRESCGKEYYDGTDVSIVRFRRVFPTRRTDVEELVSLVAFRNLAYGRGLWKTCEYLDHILERILKYFPVVCDCSPALGRHSFLHPRVERTDGKLHRPVVRAYEVTSRLPSSELEDSGAMLKWFLKRGDQPFADRDHLRRAGRPDAVNIKLRWSPIHEDGDWV